MNFPVSAGIAYAHIIVMAVSTVCFSACRSYNYLEKNKELGESPATLSIALAVLFPILGGCKFLGSYILIKTFPEELVKLLTSIFSFLSGVFVLKRILGSQLHMILPDSYGGKRTFIYSQTDRSRRRREIFRINLNEKNVIVLMICIALSMTYLVLKHWTVNNVLCLLFAASCVMHLFINTFTTGCTLLTGEFLYEVLWVFSSDVMGTVASSVDSPLLVVFPSDILQSWFQSTDYITLGFLDIAIPGTFIAFLLRFDKSLNHECDLYFIISLTAYIIGLLVSTCATTYLNYGQHALLYTVPLCIVAPVITASIKGDLQDLMKYEDFSTKKE